MNEKQNHFAPGRILLGLKEPLGSSLDELFPELNIAEYCDVDEKVYNQIKDIPMLKEQAEEYRSRIGTNFMIVLTEKTSTIMECVEKVLVGLIPTRAVIFHQDNSTIRSV